MSPGSWYALLLYSHEVHFKNANLFRRFRSQIGNEVPKLVYVYSSQGGEAEGKKTEQRETRDALHYLAVSFVHRTRNLLFRFNLVAARMTSTKQEAPSREGFNFKDERMRGAGAEEIKLKKKTRKTI